MCFGDGDGDSDDGWSISSKSLYKKRRVWSPDGSAHTPVVRRVSLSPAYSTSSLLSPSAPRRSSVARRPSPTPSPPPQSLSNPPRRSPPTPATAPAAPHPPPRTRPRPRPRQPPPPPPPPYEPLARASSFPLPLPPPPFAAPSSTDLMRRHSFQSSAPSSPRPQLAHNLPWMSNVNLPSSGLSAGAGASNNTVYGAGGSRGRSRAMSSADLRAPMPHARTARPAARSVANVAVGESSGQEDCGLGAQSSSFHERLSARLNDIIDDIDHEIFRDGELVLDPLQQSAGPQRTAGPVSATRNLVRAAHGSSVQSGSFSKVWLYANSRLPPYLPPLKVYMPTYPLLCLAAKHSLRVYEKPVGTEREDRIKGSLFHRTKAMTLKSLPIDDMNTIVFAIRGSAGFIDWAVNFRPAPLSPEGFLDDPGNLCHAGFLSVAKSMIKTVAARLRTLLAENPSRSACSLLITGHSAGGAVAQLLYSHMLSRTVESELNYLVGFFKRVHCVTFGTPPVSLLPLTTPKSRLNRKSLFFSFVNEGDPVARADKAIIGSLLRLYATPPPTATSSPPPESSAFRWHKPTTWAAEAYAVAPTWPPPPATLSLGGRIVLLRPRYDGRGQDDVEACTVTDEMLRDVVFGDPACHTMAMYSKRIEILATRAVTVGGFA